MEPLLEVKNLQVDFLTGSGRINAVQEISFSIGKGETLGVVGESGCGKSVTASAIMRLLPKQTSRIAPCTSVKLNGEELTTMNNKQFRSVLGNEMSMIFQEPMTSLNPVYTIGAQLIEMIRAHERLPKKEAWDKAVSMLTKVGIPEPENRMRSYPHELSGGMRQRVMIAMALSCEPQLLVADEPTTALDVTIQAQILELMDALKKETGTSILLITHDMGVVAEVTDYVMVMYAGQIVEYDDVRSIIKTPMHPYTIGLLNSIPRSDRKDERLPTIEGTVPTLAHMPAGCRFADRCPKCTQRCRQEVPELRTVGTRKIRCHMAGEKETEVQTNA